MAKVFYISYDLRGEEREYDDLKEKLNQWKGKNILESVWVIAVNDNETCLTVKNELVKLIKKEDGLIVIEATDHSYFGLLTTTYKLS